MSSLVRSFGNQVRTINSFSFPVESESALIDLSMATKLKYLIFRVESRRVDWTNVALRTITPEHQDLRQITIYLPYDSTLSGAGANVRRATGEQLFGQWLEFDHLLVQLWESRWIRPRILYYAPPGTEKDISESVGCLLPDATKRGIIDLAEWVL